MCQAFRRERSPYDACSKRKVRLYTTFGVARAEKDVITTILGYAYASRRIAGPLPRHSNRFRASGLSCPEISQQLAQRGAFRLVFHGRRIQGGQRVGIAAFRLQVGIKGSYRPRVAPKIVLGLV